MKYERIKEGTFIERPNRFIAHVEIDGKQEVVHVKNTGRCAELLIPGVKVYIQESKKAMRKTKWDLIAVEKGNRLINMDSQIPNKVVAEWIRDGNLFPNATRIQTEKTFGNSRFDLYIEEGERKIFMEIKGVTLEKSGVVMFPDAPTERGVKHIYELMEARKTGYEVYLFFLVQMQDVLCFKPNRETHPEFALALEQAVKEGVNVLVYDSVVKKDEILVGKEVPMELNHSELGEMVVPLVKWYQQCKRDLPWRKEPTPYHVWVSEIMLQQTRVEAVKAYYQRFLESLPTIEHLANAEEDLLLKLWEGLGYYNRVRNMQKAAVQIMEEFQGVFPQKYEDILKLKGIGSYTAGAISSFAYGIPKPAVDGNVLRVMSRITESYEDISKASVKKELEEKIQNIIPKDRASDFNQGLIELGAIVCVPNGFPKCEICPVSSLCIARKNGTQMELPIKEKAKTRKIEKKTVFLFEDEDRIAIHKRPKKGLLAGLYEFPNIEGHLTEEEALEYAKDMGLSPIYIKKLEEGKHIFSHKEWHMKGYYIRVDELEKSENKEFLFIHPREIEREFPIPSAFEIYANELQISLGKDKEKDPLL